MPVPSTRSPAIRNSTSTNSLPDTKIRYYYDVDQSEIGLWSDMMPGTFGHIPLFQSRRDFLCQAGGGFGALAFAALAQGDDTPQKPHFAAKAKSVIFLFMEGGPSHVDLTDPKPELTRQNGKPLPASFGKVLTPMGTGGNNLLASKRKFAKHGQAGLDFSDWLPNMAKCADDFALLRACWADGLNHVGSVCQMNTGSVLAGRPSLGSWSVYGLGSENRNLPGFVVLTDGGEVTDRKSVV